MARTVTIHEAKTHLSRLIRDCVAGEDVVIARGKQPMVKLVPVVGARKPREFGLHRGLVEMSPDFDDPLDDFEEYT